MCEYMGRATQDVPVYNCDYSLHYNLILTPPDSSLALEGPMSLRPSVLDHPSWSRLKFCIALDCIVMHCNTLFDLQYQ